MLLVIFYLMFGPYKRYDVEIGFWQITLGWLLVIVLTPPIVVLSLIDLIREKKEQC